MYNQLTITGYGVQSYIDDMINKLKDNLWTDRDYTPYGHVEIVDGEPHKLDGREYTEVLIDDNRDATSFFHVEDEMETGAVTFTATVNIIFQVNTSKFADLINARGQYQLIHDAISVINKSPFNIQTVRTGMAVYDTFGIEEISKIMAPYLVFAVETELFGNHKT